MPHQPRNEEIPRQGAALSGLIGILAGFAVLTAAFAVGAGLVSSGKLPESATGFAATLCVFLGGLAAGIISAWRYGRRKLLVGLFTGAVLSLICAVIALLAGGALPDNLARLLTLPIGGGLGGMLSALIFTKRRH
jgi:putative membrane protein (TIGR04086 family)